MHRGSVLRGGGGPPAGLPPPSHHPRRLSCASRGETRALQSIRWPAARPRPRPRRRLLAPVRNPRRPLPPPGARAAGSAAEGPGAGDTRQSPPLPASPSPPGSAARGRSRRLIFHAPQTASLGDARVCAVPLKAAGSVLLSFSTGCQNMQIRGPESAAKSRRRGAAGASPDPLLVWLFPAWPAAPRPSLQPPGPLPRPAGLTLPPTPPGRPLAPPGREPGAGGAACPDSGRSGGPPRSAPSPRRAGGGEPGGAAPPLYRCGEPGTSGGRVGWGEGARGRRESLLSQEPEKIRGRPGPPTPGSPRSGGEGSEVVIHPHHDEQLGSSSHTSPARVALPRSEARGSSLLPPCQHSHSP